jgi:hypothetical protein
LINKVILSGGEVFKPASKFSKKKKKKKKKKQGYFPTA